MLINDKMTRSHTAHAHPETPQVIPKRSKLTRKVIRCLRHSQLIQRQPLDFFQQ